MSVFFNNLTHFFTGKHKISVFSDKLTIGLPPDLVIVIGCALNLIDRTMINLSEIPKILISRN